MNEIMKKAADICIKILPKIEEISNDYLGCGRLLWQRLNQVQVYVTVIGEVSTGKSTLINSLLNANYLPVKASPTTGTVVQVELSEQEDTEFYIINKDGTIDQINEPLFQEYAITPDSNTLRLLLCTKPVDSNYIGTNIFDTPGYNSLIAEHDEILREFIPNSDLLIFVCGYRTGFNQIDQDLFEVVRESIPERDIPILLIINRIPDDINMSSSKVREIVKNAEDSLLQNIDLLLVEEVYKKIIPDSLPNTQELWNRINSIINDPLTMQEVNNNLLLLLNSFINDMITSVNSKISYNVLAKSDIDNLKDKQSILNHSYIKSNNLVKSYSEKLRNILNPSIEEVSKRILMKIEKDILSSNKWLGRDDTYAWITGHALPNNLKSEAEEIQRLISNELERLDKELKDIANNAIKKIEHKKEIITTTEYDILNNAFNRFARKTAGKYISRYLVRLGGRGGIAAGSGNLVKMSVKRIGKLFGKKFSRPVYAKIGRIFTKKFIGKLNVALLVAIEGIDFLVESSRWKKKLIKAVRKSINEWKDEVKKDVFDNIIPSIEKENIDIVESIYLEDLNDIKISLQLNEKEMGSKNKNLEEIKEILIVALDELSQLINKGGNYEY